MWILPPSLVLLALIQIGAFYVYNKEGKNTVVIIIMYDGSVFLFEGHPWKVLLADRKVGI